MKQPQNSLDLDRRRFLKAGLLSSATLAIAAPPRALLAAVTKSPRAAYDGLKLGVASYTFRKFSLDQAIAMSKQVGAGYISLKDFHLSYKSTPDERREARRKIEAAGLVLISGGVIYMKNNEEEIRGFFDYARDAGMPTIVASPDIDALDTVEKMAKDYDIRIAIHNHGPEDKLWPSPLDILKDVRNMDDRIGCCIDVGHTERAGTDVVQAIQEVGPRLFNIHMKDLANFRDRDSQVAVGEGIMPVRGIFEALVATKYEGFVDLEYEIHPDDPMPGVIESFAYMRGVLAGMGHPANRI